MEEADNDKDDVDATLNEVEGEIEEQNVEPPAKMRRIMKKKMATVEKVMTNMMQAFVESQRESEERFLKYEERRAKEERAHEERILQLLLHAPSIVKSRHIYLHILQFFIARLITSHTCNNWIPTTMSNVIIVV